MFPTVRDYEADNARKTDWFIQFRDIDRAVDRQRQTEEQRGALGGG